VAESNRSLTAQQEAFALGVASGKTQADAYRASYKAGRMTPKQIHEEASKLAGNPKVAQRVAELKERITNTGIASASRVLLEASRLALFDPRKLFNADGSPKPIGELDDDTAAALAGLDVQESFEGSGDERVFVGYVKKYKVADKNSALEKLFKHHGLYELDNKQKTDPLAELLKSISGAALPVVKSNGDE
jgi:phage terminase small subunit